MQIGVRYVCSTEFHSSEIRANKMADQHYTEEVAARRPGKPTSVCELALLTSSLRFEGRFARAMFPERGSDEEMVTRDRDPTADARAAAGRDVADLLYRYGIGSVAVSLFASSGLAFISVGQLPSSLLGLWWLFMTAVLVLRGLDIFLRRFRTSTSDTPAREIRRFGIGLIAASALWAAFPQAFLARLNQTGRAYTAIVLCGMVGGSVTVLAPSRGLSLAFCAFLVLPASIRFLCLAGDANKFLGLLGCFFFLVML